MKYEKYDDVSALLNELCLPFSDDELMTLARIGAKMANDEGFNKAYTMEVKSRYLAHLPAIQDSTYIPQKFEALNYEICEHISTRTKVPAVLLPGYANLNREEKENIAEATGIRAKILKLRQKSKS